MVQGSVLKPNFVLQTGQWSDRPYFVFCSIIPWWFLPLGKCVQHQTAQTPLSEVSLHGQPLVQSIWFGNLYIQNCCSSFHKKREPDPINLVFQSTTVSLHHSLRKEYKYLGVFFQSKGLHQSHIQHVFDKCQKRLNVLRLLKGTSWGAAKAPPLPIYRTLIRSVIESDVEAFLLDHH